MLLNTENPKLDRSRRKDKLISEVLSTSIIEVDSLQKNLKKGRNNQVQAADERSLIKATCLSWFNNHRPRLVPPLSETDLSIIDNLYKSFLSRSDHNGARKKYLTDIKTLRKHIIGLRSLKISVIPTSINSGDLPPDFSPLIGDKNMRSILERRWVECSTCINAAAPLAATVMMGGLLEALLLARIHRETDKTKIMNAKAAPKDKAGSKTLSLQEWTLKDFIDVLHETQIISRSVKDIGSVLRDYRNYIHPYKELSHAIKLEPSDSALLWEITKGIARDLLKAKS